MLSEFLTTSGRLKYGSGEKLVLLALSCDSDACLLWPGSIGSHGYPQRNIGGQVTLVHREVCERHRGPPPSEEHQAAHTCGNSPCFARNHLVWKTPVENAEDRVLHGTDKRPDSHGTLSARAVLTEADVALIRVSDLSQRKLAAIIGCGKSTVGAVRAGKTKHT